MKSFKKIYSGAAPTDRPGLQNSVTCPSRVAPVLAERLPNVIKDDAREQLHLEAMDYVPNDQL